MANGEIQLGELPAGLHVVGPIAWWIFRGSHDGMGAAWELFGEKLETVLGHGGVGPPGDIYLCDPEDHPGDWEAMLTVLWAPRE